ncbi:NACHT domain-containing protein [Sphingomonas psychrotolerans]|uniref:NACHT domain-containing protein n=1 Tax=Sphingomonas psychrotolerans TaxID=1327635 RepID=A0A2K8MHZ6_9SPHN|nr:NACHT domain-containing protein [Sphingomonas psychrotolerans]ATY30791.1 hypothetical protein CVN68_01270 [Sphingomonas psychrotolerans]
MVAKSLIDALTNFDASAVITKALVASGPKVVAIAATQARKTPERISSALGLGFSHHLQTTFDKCYKIKTLIYRDEPVELLSQYVSIKLGLKKAKLTDNYIIENLEEYKNVIVQGGGGSGKTMFMKYLALCRFENPRGRIPIFIELRTLDYTKGKPIEQLIFEDSTSKKSKMTFDNFEKALTGGLFLIVLDGLDEVDPEYRESIHKQIIKIPAKYPDNILIISSREDASLSGWARFYCFRVLPLDKRQVTSVIKKINFDKTIKEKFLKDLAAHLYKKHESFLTNPLLATIMLLRYDQFANAGDKIHIFYDQAFETLFFKHDLSKGVYERKRYTNISVDDFKRFFSAFCFSSYAKNKYAFSRSELIAFIEKSLKYCGISAQPAAVLRDLFESVCIIQEDGLLYTFVHRSFQEYFAALFVATYRGEKDAEYTNIIMSRNNTESAGTLLREMSPILVDKLWALPLLEDTATQFERFDPAVDPGGMLKFLSDRYYVGKDGAVQGFGIDGIGDRLLTINRYYRFGLSSWLDTHLFMRPKELISSLRDRVPVGDRDRFRARWSELTDSKSQFEAGVITSDDNYWVVHTNAVNVLGNLADKVVVARNLLREQVAQFNSADDGLL